jgi:hypothetical protein
MKTKDLIEVLRTMPPDSDVYHLWDGEPRTAIAVVYLSRNGDVITADYDMVCYTDRHRPADAPSSKEEPYWCTADTPETR